jgi:FkbM family methyltransferase
LWLFLEKTMDYDFSTTTPTTLTFWAKRRLKKFYQNFIGNSDFMIAIGDHQGIISDTSQKIGALTLIVEPLPDSYRLLCEKFASSKNVILLHTDIGAFDAAFTFNEAYEKNILPYSSNLTASASQPMVKITTLDEIIVQHGIPIFLKINANGFENEVLKGLNTPILTISVAFYSYLFEKTIENIRRILEIGNYEFNWILDEEPSLQSKEWLDAKALHQSMSDFNKQRFAGQIFARIKN